MTLTELLNQTHPDFQAALIRIAAIAKLTPEQVYSFWREYARTCEGYDQSALLSEFVDWYGLQFGGDQIALHDAAQMTPVTA